MSHIVLLYAPEDHVFAHQLAVQLNQRGLAIWPVPDPNDLLETPDAPGGAVILNAQQAFEQASHVLGIMSPEAVASDAVQQQCVKALESGKRVIAVKRHPVDLPEHLQDCKVVDFDGPFLLAVESLVKRLKSAKAPTRPLTVEHAPTVARPGLLPLSLPAERCWRDDRLRINYNLPVILTREELETRVPAFFAAARFEMIKSTNKEMRGRRLREFKWFDPRRAVHTIAVRRRKGSVRVIYRMTRVQVYHWFRAHYYTFNRESAALYRYLVTGEITPDLLEPVHRQARRARVFSWLSVAGVMLVLVALLLILF